MKPSTKKTIIVLAAIAAIIAVVYFLFFNKAKAGTAEGYIDRLQGVSRALKNAIKGNIERAKTEQDITANAASNAMNYEQALALSAAYYLVNDGTVDDATWQQWAAQVRAMG